MTRRDVCVLLLCGWMVGCSSSTDTGAPSPPDAAAGPNAAVDAGRDPQAPETYQVRFDTTEGEVLIDVDRKLAPHGADRFYRLVKDGFYDGAKFFRVLPDFMVQVGMAADPKVNAKWQNAYIDDDPARESNTRGTVTFATSGPNRRTSQIFINTVDNTADGRVNLDVQGFSPFGRVTKGLENIDKLYAEYGEGAPLAPLGDGPSQPAIAAEGNAYLEREFPKLDAITTATVVAENGEPVGGDEKNDSPEVAAPSGAKESASE